MRKSASNSQSGLWPCPPTLQFVQYLYLTSGIRTWRDRGTWHCNSEQKHPSTTTFSPAFHEFFSWCDLPWNLCDLPKSAMWRCATDVPLLQRFPIGINGGWWGGHREPQLKTCRRWPLRRQNEYSFPVKHCETMEMTTHWKHTAENKPFTKNATKTCFLSFCLVFGLFDGAYFKTGFLVLCIGLGQVLVHHALSISRLPYRTT